MTDPYILIVDDDEDARTILCKIMEALGMTTRQAANGAEALAIIQEQRPALVLLDLMMPVMNGFEVLFRMHGDPQLRRIPVIVVSAVTQEELLMVPGVSRVFRKAQLRASDVQTTVTGLLGHNAANKSPRDEQDAQVRFASGSADLK